MVKSMTGFGRASKETEDFKVTIELKAVNHRYLETVFRLPRQFHYMEASLKKVVAQKVKRGRLECFFSFEGAKVAQQHLSVDWELLDHYVRFLRQAKERYTIQEEVNFKALLSDPAFLTVNESSEADPELPALITSVLEKAVTRLDDMRSLEGAELALYLKEHLVKLEGFLEAVKAALPEMEKAYREKLEDRLNKLVGAEFDKKIVLSELALLLEKADINEEIERFASHLKQFYSILTQEGAIGRKLDFLIQEMNREVNTMGSKAMSLQVTQSVVEMKTTLEKIREQVQNVE
ncbi:YicC/YloC family endoribonuclease [Listeria aquatica]|uniref:YicC/YloC family endoribonuclease n=1 Tax=Listeria aquatica TaxID=1494960 RepID=UPI003EF5FDE0